LSGGGGVILVLIILAALLRVNSIVAAIPFLFLLIYEFGLFSKKWLGAIIVIILIALPIGVGKFIDYASGAKYSDSTVTMYALDIANLASAKEINESAEISDTDIKTLLVQMSESICSHNNENKSLELHLWKCGESGKKWNTLYVDYGTLENATQIKNLWIRLALEKPLKYLLYKIDTYSAFLFDTGLFFQSGINKNKYGYQVKSMFALSFLNTYVNQFGVKFFGIFFMAWFYLLSSIAILYYSIRNKLYHRRICITLSSSSILYILSYTVANITLEYRYIYWSVFATIIASILIGLDIYQKIKSVKIVNQIT
jgi:hypothetical protein